MSICCVTGCEGPKQHEVYFDFPASRLLRKRWLAAIGAPKVPPDSRICQRHFAPGDYEVVRGKTRLKGRVVPSMVAGEQVKNDDTETSQESTETAGSDSINVNNKKRRVQRNHENNQINDNNDRESDMDSQNTENSVADENGRNNGSNDKCTERTNDKNNDRNNDDSNDKCTDHTNDKENGRKSDGSNDKCPDHTNDKENGRNNDDSRDGSNDKCTDRTNDNENGRNHIDSNDKCPDHINDKENESVHNVEENDVDKNKRINVSRKNRKETTRKTRFKVTPKRVNTRKYSSDSTNSSSSVQSVPPQPDTIKEDIEGILTHYYIENKKTERQVAAMTDALPSEQALPGEQDCAASEQAASNDPVYIELSVGNDATDKETSNTNDCLMVLESVQCEVDPAMLLAAREMDHSDTDDEPVEIVDISKPDPISLLTSSDEDDVILEEPHIDTVEVSSSETDEDDVPLVKLVNPRLPRTKAALLTKLMWSGSDYYCAKCRFTTLSSSEYTKHMHSHLKVMQVCQDCGFTTASKAQLCRHAQKHKNDKRYKCYYCNYSAKHKMSLMYHMRTHKNLPKDTVNTDRISYKDYRKKVKVFTKSDKKSAVKSVKRYSCSSCNYNTDRRSDMKRHMSRKHQEVADDDDEYLP